MLLRAFLLKGNGIAYNFDDATVKELCLYQLKINALDEGGFSFFATDRLRNRGIYKPSQNTALFSLTLHSGLFIIYK